MTEVGETVTRVDALIRQTQTLQELCAEKIERADEVIATGKFICFLYHADSTNYL